MLYIDFEEYTTFVKVILVRRICDISVSKYSGSVNARWTSFNSWEFLYDICDARWQWQTGGDVGAEYVAFTLFHQFTAMICPSVSVLLQMYLW